jgi:excisionase family DNA binding protein
MNLLKVKEAAGILHCHPFSIYAAIYEGRIKAFKFRGGVRIQSDEVERLALRKERFRSTLNVRETARILSCSYSSVLRLIRSQKIKASILGNSYRIEPDELENYVRSLPCL